LEDSDPKPAELLSHELTEAIDEPLVVVRGGHAGGFCCLVEGHGGQEPPAVSLQLDHVLDGVGDRSLEPQVHRSRGPLVEASEERAHEQANRQVVRPVLDFPLVTPASVPDRGGDVRHPAKATHPFEGFAVGGVSDSLDDLLHLSVEKVVVLGGVESVVGLDEIELRQG